MNLRLPFPAPCALALSVIFALTGTLARAQDPANGTLRSQAVLNLTFDEPSGDPLDSAAAGTAKEETRLVNGLARVKSPFPGQKGKQALLFNSSRKQLVQVNDSPDLDRSEALSVSFYFINLVASDDAAPYGIVAKRSDAQGEPVTNYGINYVAKNDVLQLYVNDGSGFRAATYSMQAAIGHRRLVHLTATFEVGDAPAPDEDADQDDLLVRLYVNGQPLAPKGATPAGSILGQDAWLTDVKVAGLLNDAPLTLGSSTPSIEFSNGVLDEFLLFPRALSAEEAARLFTEVAGPDAAQLTKADADPKPLASPPELATLSAQGLQIGKTTSFVVSGTDLLPDPVFMLPVPIARQVIGPNSSPSRVELELTLAADLPAGIFALRVQTPHGISNSLPLALDTLPEAPQDGSSRENPLTTPVAVSGLLSGPQQTRVYFSGKAQQKVIVDVEAKRLGAAMTPVLELKNLQGTPLLIQWGQIEFRGDPRMELKLPADGIYIAELHDLAYQAPGTNPFRIKIGDFKLVDSVFPTGVSVGTQESVTPFGPGLDGTASLPVDLRELTFAIPQAVPLPQSLGAVAPAPGVLVSDGIEVVEQPLPQGVRLSIDARFADSLPKSMIINGRLSQRREQDRYFVQVVPDQKVNFSIVTRAINSPLDPQIAILKYPEGDVLATAEDPGPRQPTLDFTVPAGVNAIQVAVKDVQNRGGTHYLYRLRISPAGQPDFNLILSADRVHLRQDGSALLQLEVVRTGYSGPVKLSLHGDPHMMVTPAEIPAGVNKSWLTLARKGGDAALSIDYRSLQLIGESLEVTPPLRRLALAAVNPRMTMVHGERGNLLVGLTPSAGISFDLGAPPPALFRGVETEVPLTMAATGSAPARVMRLSLISSEADRRIDNNDPQKGNKLKVAALPNQTLQADEEAGSLRINVPTDIAEANIDFVIKGELVQHPYSQTVLNTSYTRPFRLPVRSAATARPAATTLNLIGSAETKFTGTVKRTEGFTGPLDLALLNLPAGYTSPKLTLGPGQENFELSVTAPAVTQPAVIPNVVFRVTSASGTPLQRDVPIATKVAPAAQ